MQVYEVMRKRVNRRRSKGKMARNRRDMSHNEENMKTDTIQAEIPL